MKRNFLSVLIIILLGAFIFSGCYTQLKLEDDEYSYRWERKKTIIEKRTEEQQEYENEDTTYESTDESVYEDEEDRYYYPSHRRKYKYYHPGITIDVGGAVFYDPWYFDYFSYPYTICRTYYLPGWYGYYSCYRVWYGFVYYDPFYNPFYSPPYWWYDPHWYGGYYPPIVQYRKNDYTRLRDNDGGRSGAIRTGNWGRDLNLQVASERSRLRDLDASRDGRYLERERRKSSDIDINLPNTREQSRQKALDRDRSSEPNKTRDRETIHSTPTDRRKIDNEGISKPKDRRSPEQTSPPKQNDRKPRNQTVPQRERVPDRTPPKRESPEQRPERRDSPSRQRFEASVPRLEEEIIIKSRTNEIRGKINNSSRFEINDREEDKPQLKNFEIQQNSTFPSYNNQRNYDSQIRIERNNEEKRTQTNKNNEYRRSNQPVYERPRFESPSRSSYPSYTPRFDTPPNRNSAPVNERGRER